jgi:predicted transcriptional regulator
MAEECGVSVAWISRFAAGKIPNPGVNTVQCLHDYLVKVNG